MLKTDQLVYQVEGKIILDQISVEMRSGEMLAVLGPNGAGKSSLLKCLSGDIPSVFDQVTINGQLLSKLSAAEMARIRAVMPQTVHLDFPFLVHEVVEMALSQEVKHSERRLLVKQALKRFDVDNLIDRSYLTLSGGEQQRVQLSRVLAQLLSQPNNRSSKILFLDECTSSLDLAHQHQVFQVVCDLIEEFQLSVLVILHDLNLASQYADRLVLMKSGEIVCQGEVSTVLTEHLIDEVYGFKSQVIKHPRGWPLVIPA